MFTPIRTERLVIRAMTEADADGLWERRNDPELGRYGDWPVPFPREEIDAAMQALAELDGPTNGHWWRAAVADAASDEVVGDLALHLGDEGRTAEVGYVFARSHWGRGYAVEALAGLVDHLFQDMGITRAFGVLHPENRASAMVLERVGFVFEGHTRLSFWLGDDNSDDHIYGMTRADWQAWRERPRTPPAEVALVPITAENAVAVRRLRTHKSQESFVAPVTASFADALVPEVIDGAPVVPWMRAIDADGQLVGFVMVACTTPHHPEPFLWRLLIDRFHQRRGIASKALDLVEAEFAAAGDRTMLVSWVPGRGSPEPFYLARGYEPTGNLLDDEVEARKPLAGVADRG